jgi:Baseplate J-like protein
MSDVPLPDGYIELPLLGDQTSLEMIGMEYMEWSTEGWRRKAGNPDTILIESSAQITGELIEQASLMPPEALIYIGTTIYNIPFKTGTEATGEAEFTFATDVPSYVVPAGAQISVPAAAGPNLVFETVEDIASPIGGGVFDVDIIASEVGVEYNNCFGPAELVEPFDGLTVTVLLPTDTGTDDETAQEYLDRLSNTLTVMSPAAILPQDHAALAMQVPGVGRATAIDLLMPGTVDEPDAIRDPNEVAYLAGKSPPEGVPTTNQLDEPRCTTVAITAEDGTAPSEELMQDVWDLLDASREVNFLNYVIPPSYTAIDVRGQVRAYPGTGTDEQAAEAAADQIRQWLDPTTFGMIPGTTTQQTWANDNKVRHDEAVDYANRGAGVWWTTAIEMKKSTDSTWTSGDITLTGVAPLVQAGTITFTPAP